MPEGYPCRRAGSRGRLPPDPGGEISVRGGVVLAGARETSPDRLTPDGLPCGSPGPAGPGTGSVRPGTPTDGGPVSPDAAEYGPASPDVPATERSVRTLSERLADYVWHIEKLNITEYIELLHNPRRMFFLGLISGIGRGFGLAIGFTLLGALVLVALRHLVMLNLPHISGFIAELVRLVQDRLRGP